MEESSQEPLPEADHDGAWQRLTAYAYLSAPERLEHVAIMRAFCGTLLADMAVPDVLAKLGDSGGPAAGLDAETLTVRLEQLVRWGNLLRSRCPPRFSCPLKASRKRRYGPPLTVRSIEQVERPTRGTAPRNSRAAWRHATRLAEYLST
ncbi:DUF2397 family protein [Streptomyces syringium]|uniref:DUF2397 family protein n=1 Tax=Streptomyces syringium TaxID=76729 RepID=UPI0033FC227E